MPKMKTRRTLLKRIKITKSGKLLKKQTGNGHLKVKKDTSAKFRKSKKLGQPNAGHVRVLKKMLGKFGKGLVK